MREIERRRDPIDEIDAFRDELREIELDPFDHYRIARLRARADSYRRFLSEEGLNFGPDVYSVAKSRWERFVSGLNSLLKVRGLPLIQININIERR